MSAYESARFDDLRQRQANNEPLTPQQERELVRLFTLDRQAWENADKPRWLGGDYPDVF